MGRRRARASFRYHAFVPDEIAGLNPVVPFEVADLSADAEAAIQPIAWEAKLKVAQSPGTGSAARAAQI